jgi:hypothetical protein
VGPRIGAKEIEVVGRREGGRVVVTRVLPQGVLQQQQQQQRLA